MKTRSPSLAAVILVWAVAGSADARQAQASNGSVLLKGLADCRAVTEATARLACFDQMASRLIAAEQAGDVVVVDRSDVRAARRQAFGFSLPSMDVFARGDRDAPLERVQLVLARATRLQDGKWLLRTQEGQVWRQIDDKKLSNSPRPGSKAEVRNAAMGSFFMNIDGQRAIRVRREQ
jgi:hypothetical protein